MSIKQIKLLQPGDQVYWNDPDAGICSRILNILTISICDDIISITDIDGSYIQCYHNELE